MAGEKSVGGDSWLMILFINNTSLSVTKHQVVLMVCNPKRRQTGKSDMFGCWQRFDAQAKKRPDNIASSSRTRLASIKAFYLTFTSTLIRPVPWPSKVSSALPIT